MEERSLEALLRSAKTTYKQNITPHTILKLTPMPVPAVPLFSLRLHPGPPPSNLKTILGAKAYLSVICRVTGRTPDTLVIDSSSYSVREILLRCPFYRQGRILRILNLKVLAQGQMSKWQRPLFSSERYHCVPLTSMKGCLRLDLAKDPEKKKKSCFRNPLLRGADLSHHHKISSLGLFSELSGSTRKFQI